MTEISQKHTSTEGIAEKNRIELLVQEAIKGDQESLISLCQAIARGILFRATRMIGNVMDAEDVAQEVLIRVCERIGGLHDPGAFQAWLSRIIVNETRRYISRNAKHTPVLNIDDYIDSDLEEEEELLPEEYAIKAEDRQAVIDIIDKLPVRQREVILLRYYDNMRVTEIAQTLDVAQPTVSRYLKLAQDKIRNEIQKQIKSTGKLYSIAVLPMGGLLSNVFRQEEAQLAAPSEGWIRQTLRGTVEKIKPVRHTGTGRLWSSFLVGTAATVITTGVITLGMWFGGVFDRSGNIPQPRVSPVITSGEIVFTGGGDNYTALNPKHAEVHAENERGSLITRYWWITRQGSADILYSGIGGSIDEVFIRMTEQNEDGEYIVSFLAEDSLEVTYTFSRQFVIKGETGE